MGDDILKDENGTRYSLENARTQGWLDGHEAGLDAAVGWLKERAVLLFRQGKDAQAIELRKLSEDMERALRPGMVAHARRHEIEHPIVVTDDADDDA